MELAVYPYSFVDGVEFHEYRGPAPYLVERAQTWSRMIEEFTALAYPNIDLAPITLSPLMKDTTN